MIFLHLVLVFLLPWIVGICHLYKKDKQVIPIIGPAFSILAFTINEFGFYFGFWEVFPFPEQRTLSALLFNFGVYPVLASYLIYFIKKYKHPFLFVFLMTLVTTLLESIYVYYGMVNYGNGWNAFYTFFSYLVPYVLIYLYYIYLKRIVL